MKIDIITITTTREIQADAVLHNNEVWKFHATGLTRRVYVNPDKTKVIKVPISNIDFRHNKNEEESWNSMSEESRKEFAECKLLSNGWLEMEYLTTLNDPTVFELWGHVQLTPEQMLLASSSRDEVGFDKNGNLKCFDYDEYRKY